MACGFPPLAGPLTPPFTFSNFIVNNPGTPSATIQFDSADFFNNGLFDDNTTVQIQGITWKPCGNPQPAVNVVSRNRITLPDPNITTTNNLRILIGTTWIVITYLNGAALLDGVIVGGTDSINNFLSVSGIYQLINGKRVDTLQDRQTGVSSIDTPIPDPRFKTGYIGG
jgi:hypothetical protein